MAIITIFSGTFCHGEEIADGVAKKLGYQRSESALFDLVAQKFNISVDKLQRAISGEPGYFNRMTHGRERAVAYLRFAFSEMLNMDGIIFHGFESHLMPPDITHVLKVCAIANFDYRVEVASKLENISATEALKRIHHDDTVRKDWSNYIRNHEPYDERMYDVLLAMQTTDIETAINSICDAANNSALTVTPAVEESIKDFKLAALVQIVLAEKGFDVDVNSKSGLVHVDINKYTSRLEKQQQKINDLAQDITGVKEVTSGPGTRFTPPSLLREPKLDMPSKILLVDDEKEFVHTLSERLQTRSLETSIVYDGEEALEFIKNDEPEVIVLDLKMPGIDGIEVLRRVKRDYPNIEVIILTGHGSDKEKGLAFELGAFAYLQKPVNIDILAKTMKEANLKIEKNSN
jgi:two-component system, OmpR family, response regulator CpxR